MSWQSSNDPSTASACTPGRSTVVICRRCTSDTRPCGIQDEHVRALAAAERLDRRRAGVARGRAENDAAPVALGQRPVHRAAEETHREILERQRRPVEQLEQEQIVVELDQRRARGVAEVAIGVFGHRQQFGVAPAAADEGRHQPCGRLRVGLTAQGFHRPRATGWERLRACRGRHRGQGPESMASVKVWRGAWPRVER